MPMMGRGSDTRMYSPRSESAHMYSSANEDGDKYSPTSPEDADKRREEKQRKDEERKSRLKDIKHIKIKPSQGLGSGPSLPREEGLDDGNKRDDEREISLQGGPAGSRGHLLDLATGAKTGTGSAMGTGNSAVRTGEPMDDAWSTLLKEDDDVPDMDNFKNPGTQSDMYMDYYMEHIFDQGYPLIPYKELNEKQKMIIDMIQSAPRSYFNSPSTINSFETDAYQNLFSPDRHHLYSDEDYDEYARYLKHYFDASAAIEDLPYDVKMEIAKNVFYAHDMKEKDPNFDLTPYKDDFEHPLHPDTVARKKMAEEFEHWNVDDPHTENYYRYEPSSFDRANFNEGTGFTMSEPMDNAWSELLKRDTPKKIQARRRREARQEFRPSTGQFKKPPGGQSGGAGATMRRFKARMRGIKGGKRTGLMKPHLSVEMSHRGIATKQPMSKDPQKYRQYMGQQEAQKILGGVRNTFSPHARHSARSFVAGPTGGGRLTGMLPGQAGQMRQPSLTRLSRPRRPRMPRMPRMPRPPMPPQMPMMPPAPPAPIMTSEDTPSQIMMSSDRTESEILKANRHARKLEMLELMRRLIDLQKKRNKLMKYVQGGGSAFENGHVPTHPAGVQQHEDEDEKNDGPTQNLETNSSRLGLDPAGHLSGKRGHFG